MRKWKRQESIVKKFSKIDCFAYILLIKVCEIKYIITQKNKELGKIDRSGEKAVSALYQQLTLFKLLSLFGRGLL